MPTKLFLIRHGSTDWNVEHRYCGFTDLSLNNKGKAQARRLRKRLRKEIVHKVYSSDRKRCIETAGIIFKEHYIEKIPGLREMCFGIFEGLKYRQIMKKFPVVYKKWIDNPYKTVIPSGETLGILKRRVVRAFKKILLECPGLTLAVVCHGGAISIFINYILKSKDFWRYIPQSASLSIIESKNKEFTINTLNDISHLPR